ncbi:AI-2E family transporter [Aestuariibius insulae]|uniref:AI-2E family transporter n=1 Tax=Aestuariibius insulae TaxID=2058287 RepID=UPI00345E67C3
MSQTKIARPAAPGWAIIGLFVLSAGAAIVLARAFLMPVILAFLLSLTFSPVRRVLARRGVPDAVTALLVLLALVTALGAAVMGLSTPVQTYASDASTIAADVERKLRGLSSAVEKVAEASEEVEKIAAGSTEEDASSEAERVVVDEPSLLSQAVTSAPALLAQLVLTLALMFFLIASGDMFYEKIVQAHPRFADKKRSITIAFDIERKISRYFLTITVINAGLGVAIGVALFLLDMPNPVLFGAMAFVLNFVPFLGAIIGVIITAAIGLVTYDQAGSAVLAALVYLGLTSLEGQFITPYAVGRSLKLNPVVVFLAVAFWGWAWSVIGMVIAVPVLIALRVFSEHVPGMHGLGLFLAGRGSDLVQTDPPEPTSADPQSDPATPPAPHP